MKIFQVKGNSILVDDEDWPLVIEHAWRIKLKGERSYVYRRKKKSDPDDSPSDIMLHRIIMNPLPDQIVDHKNRNTLDNRRDNLRVCNHSQNNCNRKGRGSSKYLGVHFYKKKERWISQITDDGRIRSIGSFSTEEAAAKAYDKEAIKVHGEFANLNFK